jgi:pyruvate dehydrogenase E1 component beta subunit
MIFAEAINTAIVEEMQRDPDVIFYGQNMGMTDVDPMVKMFGRNRVRLTPISETAELGIAVGAALTGLRPIVELWMAEFMLVALDQVVNEAPRFRYMSGGQVKVPLVFKAGFGFAAGWAGQHSNCPYNMLLGVPGLRVVVPSTPADAKGLMTTAIRDDNPVVYLNHFMLTLDKGEVPEGDYAIPFGLANVRRPGSDVTIVATGWMVNQSIAAADLLARDGINAEVIDPRTLAPLDTDAILESVAKTGRLVLVDQAPRHGSVAALIAAEVAEKASIV